MIPKKLKEKLAKSKKIWKNARENAQERGTGGYEEYDDGRYLGQLVSLEVGESQSSGRVQLDWGFKFLEGDYKGKTKHDYQGLESEQNLEFVAQRISQFGYEIPEDIDDIEEVIKDLLKEKPIVRFQLKTKGEFQNVRILKVLGKDEAEGAEDATEGAEESEEISETEESEEGTEIKKGMSVTVKIGGKELTCEVIEVLEAEDKLRVKTEEGKIYKITSDKVTGIVETEEVPEEPETEEESEEESEEEETEEEEEEETEEEEEEEQPKKKKVVKKTSSLPKKKGKK